MKSSSGYEIYHNTLSACLDEIESYVTSKGYTLGDYFPLINHISYGSTERTQLEMLKDGRIANTLAIQIYRLDSGKYELNCYPVRKFSGGGGLNKSKFKAIPNAKYENNYELHTSKKTLLIDPETNKIISTHSSPYEAMKERDRQNNPNLLIHFEKFSGGGTASKTFKHKQYNITYQVKPSMTKKSSWEVVESSPNWKENQTFYFVSESDAINYAKLNAGIKTEEDSEARFMRNQYSKGGYTRPSYKIITTGFFSFKTKDKEYYVRSGLFERQNDTEDSLQIQDELRGELGSIIIQNSAWKRLSDGKTIKARSSKGNLMGTLTRVAMINDSFQPNKPMEIVPYSVGDRFKYNFDNKTYEVIGIGYNSVRLQPINDSWFKQREVTLSLMNKWILQKMMVKL
jgi:hypothetical protein